MSCAYHLTQDNQTPLCRVTNWRGQLTTNIALVDCGSCKYRLRFPEAHVPVPKPGGVTLYMLLASSDKPEYVKLGISNQLTTLVDALAQGPLHITMLASLPGLQRDVANALAKSLRVKFKDLRFNGTWYRYREDMAAALDAMGATAAFLGEGE